MTGRPRNIRRKAADDAAGDEEEAPVQIRTRPAKPAVAVKPLVHSQLPAVALDQIPDRIQGQFGGVDDSEDEEESLLLRRRAEVARAQRERKREDAADFIALETDEPAPHPLAMIADTGVDEEVFEAHRGRSIRFAGFEDDPLLPDPATQELAFEDDAARSWERDQIRKGMASAGVKPGRAARLASERIRAEPENLDEELALIDFDTLDSLSTGLLADIQQLEATLLRQQEAMPVSAEKAIPHDASAEVEVSRRRIFFAELAEYIDSFSGFASEAMRLMDAGEHEQATALFEEASSELSHPGAILERMTAWQSAYPETFDMALAKHAMPYLFEAFVQRQLSTLEPYGEEQVQLEELPNGLGIDLEAELRQNLLVQVYPLRLLSLLANTFQPDNTLHATRLRDWLASLTSLLGAENRSLRMFRLLVADLIDDAKRACEPGSERLQHICLAQSILQL